MKTPIDLDSLKEFNIRTLDNNKPHPGWGGWLGFLKSCEARQWEYGVVFYGKTNCNYILFPNGTIIENFGFWGSTLMREIAQRGWENVFYEIVDRRKQLEDALNGISL